MNHNAEQEFYEELDACLQDLRDSIKRGVEEYIKKIDTEVFDTVCAKCGKKIKLKVNRRIKQATEVYVCDTFCPECFQKLKL